MPGTKAGGKRAAKTILANDPDFYKRIGAEGGKASHKGGFYDNRAEARYWGRIGGQHGKGVKKRKRK